MKNSCPNFHCLDYSIASCSKYPACEGCVKLFQCENCQNQSTLVDKTVLKCDMIGLPAACRVCTIRNTLDFSQAEHCRNCWVNTRKNETVYHPSERIG